MLSWVLASASPTPNTPAHQLKTIVTGIVRKNVMGLFSKGVQETLEVKLRLVPVPTVLQSEYLESMHKYRELSNIIPGDFDAQAWSTFIQQNPAIFVAQKSSQSAERIPSPIDQSGIERFHQLLSEGTTPREFPVNRGDSPSTSPYPPPSRTSTPGGVRPSVQQTQHPTSSQLQATVIRGTEVSNRPSSRASTHEIDYARQTSTSGRRGSLQSEYISSEESSDQQPRKRAKLFRSDWPGKNELNIERQPGSLRVAASTAASVRIHRPTPVNPSIVATIQGSHEDPIRPPTPISRSRPDVPRRSRPIPSLLRERSGQSTAYRSPYAPTEDRMSTDTNSITSPPEENHYQGIFEQHFNMPSSPPVMNSANLPNPSSPVLPPNLPIDLDSGFMSTSLEELIDDEGCMRTNIDDDTGTPFDDCRRTNSNATARDDRIPDSYSANSPPNSAVIPVRSHENFIGSDSVFEQSLKEAPPSLPPQRTSGSRPSSRASIRPTPKPLAPAPMSQSEVEQLMNSIPASDPIQVPPARLQHSQSWAGPMSDFPTIDTPGPQPMEDGKGRSGAGARRVRQVQARLDQCIRDGRVPPYCENCGAIETPTWRRAWSKELQGSEQDAQEFAKDPLMLFWHVAEKNEEGRVIKFKLFKKTLADTDNDFVQILLCNPCGLWLHKFKTMRPENKWNKPPKDKRKRPSRSRKGPLSASGGAATRSRSRTNDGKPTDSSPGQSDTSSPPCDDGVTPHGENENENEDELQDPPCKRRRANSVDPERTIDTTDNRWRDQVAIEALRRAIQSSPARNLETRNSNFSENQLTPKPVRRALFPSAQDSPIKSLKDSSVNSLSPRRSPRIASRNTENRGSDKENQNPVRQDNLDELFESPPFELEAPSTPTPKRRSPRGLLASGKSLSMPFCSPTAPRSNSKGGTPRLTPAKLIMERLQRAQQQARSAEVTPSRKRKEGEFALPELPSVGGTPRSRNQVSLEGLSMDIFDELVTADPTLYNFLSPKGSNGVDWTHWIPTDLPSPSEVNLRDSRLFSSTNNDYSEDIMNAILSDADAEHADLRESAFNSLIFGESNGQQENGSQQDTGDYFTKASQSSGTPEDATTHASVTTGAT